MIVRILRERWESLFAVMPAAYLEVLLILLLASAIRMGLLAVFRPAEVFFQQTAFDSVTVGVRGVGWASCLPPSWILSYRLEQAVSLCLCVSCICWAVKRLLPWSALVTALSYGLLICLQQSREFNYRHEWLPSGALMVLFAAFYTLRHREVAQALRTYNFWTQDVYPRWVFALILIYMGSYYTFGGLMKLWMGRLEAGSGLTLQLTIGQTEGLPLPAQLLVDHRWLATLAMTATVILESGAVVMFWIPRMRPWWAIGLSGLHVGVIVTMKIYFLFNIIVLTWIAIPGQKWLPLIRSWILRRVGVFRVSLDRCRPWTRTAIALLYPFDFLGLFQIQTGNSPAAEEVKLGGPGYGPLPAE